MQDTIKAEEGTMMWYGLEYQPTAQLEALYGNNKDWGYFKTQLTKGVTYPVWKIGPNRRFKNLHKMLEIGKHKSVEDNIDVIQ